MNDIKKKNIILSIIVIMVGLMLAGGTYAYMSLTVNTTNKVYNVKSLCFLIDYNTSEVENNQGTNLYSNLSGSAGVGITVTNDTLVINRTGITGDTYKAINASTTLQDGKNYVLGFNVSGLDNGETAKFGIYFSGHGITNATVLTNGYNTIPFIKYNNTTSFTLDLVEADSSSNLTLTMSGFYIYEQSQDITGTLFPSGTISKGMSGHVSLKTNESCTLGGLGTLKLHINSGTSSKLTTPASSYCEDRSTLEPISGITTEEACHATEVNGRWRGYGDSYCESTTTLERLDYTESECPGNGGTWKSGGSPLKYAVYNNASGVGIPVAKGYITSANIGNDITIYNNFAIDSTEQYYYVVIWLDGYLTDSTYTELTFSGYLKAEATQT